MITTEVSICVNGEQRVLVAVEGEEMLMCDEPLDELYKLRHVPIAGEEPFMVNAEKASIAKGLNQPTTAKMTDQVREAIEFLEDLDGSDKISPTSMTQFELDFMGSNIARHSKYGEDFNMSPKQLMCVDRMREKYESKL